MIARQIESPMPMRGGDQNNFFRDHELIKIAGGKVAHLGHPALLRFDRALLSGVLSLQGSDVFLRQLQLALDALILLTGDGVAAGGQTGE
jgi:hypothetical protein